jgi:hypothetical protein
MKRDLGSMLAGAAVPGLPHSLVACVLTSKTHAKPSAALLGGWTA